MATRIQLRPASIAKRGIDWLAALTHAAFLVAVSVVVARATMSEALREPFRVTPGSQPYPRGAGPAAGLVLDLLSCAPALLVLIRRAADGTYVVRWNVSHVLTGLLAAWTAASVAWADDKFAAAVSAAHVVAAFALLWATSELVRSWLRFRTVAAVCYGLLLLYLAQAAMYRLVELPDTQKNFLDHKSEFLKERGWRATDFLAQQFEKKITSGEMVGFNGSANSFAAGVVILAGVSAGLILQRFTDGGQEAIPWGIGLALALPAAFWALYHTQSKAAFATPVLIALILLTVWALRASLGRRPGAAYLVGLAIVLAAAAGVVGYGLHAGGLPTASLNFRWRYWVAAWRMFRGAPWLGVGWGNFGPHYLRYRLPVASEEIRDPHDFVLRFLTELGLVGAGLALAWLGRLWWEMTRPVVPPAPGITPTVVGDAPTENARPENALPGNAQPGNSHAGQSQSGKSQHGKSQPARVASLGLAFSPVKTASGIGTLAAVAALGMTLAVLASLDFSQSGAFLVVELMKRLLFGCALMIGSTLALLKSLNDPAPDDRPAPWVLYGVLASLGVFLVHNLIEFSLFETGPLMLFALLAGAALGVRQPQAAGRRRSAAATAFLVAACAGWVAAALLLVLPTVSAEALARDGDDALRAGRATDAAGMYLDAYLNHQRLDADYPFRSAIALAYGKTEDRAAVNNRLALAIARDPSAVQYYLARARVDEELGAREAAKADFAKATELNPNEVSIRLDYADALARLGLPADAAAQYEQALKFNDLLPTEEPKRRNDGEIRERYAAVLRALGRAPDAAAQCRQALADDASFPISDPRRLTPAQVEDIRGMMVGTK